MKFLLIAAVACVALVNAHGQTQKKCPFGYEKSRNPAIVTTTTITTITDLNTGTSRSFQSVQPDSSASYPSDGARRPYGDGVLNENEVNLLNASWNILKRRSGFAPKVFIRYFKVKPEAQKYFPEFANVSINELPNNRDFLLRANTCFSSVNLLIPRLPFTLPEKYTAILGLKNKYSAADIKILSSIFMTAMQEELGSEFTPEVRDAWKKTITVVSNYVSQPEQSATGVLNENDARLLNASWNILKRRADFAPKVFMRYFKVKPEAQKFFPEFANVPLNDLPNNKDFLLRAYTCFNSVNLIIPRLPAAFPEKYSAYVGLKNKYSAADIKKFNSIFMTAMQEELGSEFTPEVREAWKKTITAVSNYVSQLDQSALQ